MQAASYLNNAILPTVLAIIVIILIYKNAKTIRQRFFAWLHLKISKGYNEAMDKTKAELFADLQNMDWNLRNKSTDKNIGNWGWVWIELQILSQKRSRHRRGS